MIKILMLADEESANTQNWIDSLLGSGQAVVELWSLPGYTGWLRLLYIPLAVFKAKRIVKKVKPGIVIAYRTTSYGFIGALTGFRPLVLAAQGESDVWPPGHWSNFIGAFMARYAIRKAALVHAWGNNMVPSLLKLGARSDQIMVMPRGIDLSKFKYRSPFSVPSKLTMIVSRSLNPEYHHNIILKALSLISREIKGIKCELLIAGDGPLKKSLMAQAEEFGVSKAVHFLGKIEKQRLAKYLCESDIYISLPDTEGVSSSLLEAMASGCYPIVTDLPANREFIESGKNGVLVALNTIDVVNAILGIVGKIEVVKKATLINRSLVESLADARVNSVKFISKYRQLVAD